MKIVITLFITCIIFSCNTYQTKYPYTLKDFKPELRKHLQVLLNEGIIGDNNAEAYSYLNKEATENELLKLFKIEIPILRGFAYRALANRNLIDSGKLLLENLNDSAKILYGDHYGDNYEYLSDYYVFASKRRTNFDKEKIFSFLLQKNKKLTWTAKLASIYAKKGDTNYSNIKNEYLSIEDNFNENKIRFGIALAAYNKLEDTTILKQIIYLKNGGNYVKATERNFSSVTLIERFPNDCFLRIIETYLTPRPYGYGKLKDYKIFQERLKTEWHNDLILTLPLFKSNKAAQLIQLVIDKNYFNQDIDIKDYFIYDIYNKLKENNCDAFLPLINKYKNVAMQYEQKYTFKLPPIEQESILLDSLPNPNYW